MRFRPCIDLHNGRVVQIVGGSLSDDADEAPDTNFESERSSADYAILYRGNFQARVFEGYLRQMNIPYVVSGGLSFFERSEIKDVIAYLRLLANPDDDAAFLRVINTPRRNIGPATLEKRPRGVDGSIAQATRTHR